MEAGQNASKTPGFTGTTPALYSTVDGGGANVATNSTSQAVSTAQIVTDASGSGTRNFAAGKYVLKCIKT